MVGGESGQVHDERAWRVADRSRDGGQWVEAMRRAIADAEPADAGIAGRMAEVLERMALGMARD